MVVHGQPFFKVWREVIVHTMTEALFERIVAAHHVMIMT